MLYDNLMLKIAEKLEIKVCGLCEYHCCINIEGCIHPQKDMVISSDDGVCELFEWRNEN